MPCTKAHIVSSIYKQLDLPKHKSVEVVESLLKILQRTLASGEDILISGFGRFCVNEKKERRGRNPQTGKDIILRRRKLVTFKCSGVLRDRING
jgi:integration host factor subunit alpha